MGSAFAARGRCRRACCRPSRRQWRSGCTVFPWSLCPCISTQIRGVHGVWYSQIVPSSGSSGGGPGNLAQGAEVALRRPRPQGHVVDRIRTPTGSDSGSLRSQDVRDVAVFPARIRTR